MSHKHKVIKPTMTEDQNACILVGGDKVKGQRCKKERKKNRRK